MSNRRAFLVGSGLTAAMSRSAAGAGDRIRLGVIGTGTRGSYMSTVFAGHPDCEVAAMCDVFKPTLTKAAAALQSKPETYVDYRRVLERKDLDAVLVATPDHWHAQMIVEGCQAGTGWFNFFLLCTLLALPGMLLLPKVAPWNGGR